MRNTILTALLAVACTLFHPAQAQTCGILSDPNDPACKAGTSTPVTSADRAAAAAAGKQPGKGQKVCAFFDTATNRCLTMRPDTKDYDSAVQTGIQAAMMGMQIQHDALYEAGQAGVLAGFGLPSGVQLPGGALPGLGASPSASPASSAAVTNAQAQDSTMVSCTRQRIANVEKSAGRPATPDEVTQAMKSCDTP